MFLKLNISVILDIEKKFTKWKEGLRYNGGAVINNLGLCCVDASGSGSSSAAGPCGFTANVISAHLNTKPSPGMFSLRSASSFACFQPARILGAGADFHPAACPRLLLWLPKQAAEPLYSAPRIIPHPVASRSAGECPSDTRSQPPPTLSCSRRCLHPPSSGCASARPALLSSRPDGKRGAWRGEGALGGVCWCVFTNLMRWCFSALWCSRFNSLVVFICRLK